MRVLVPLLEFNHHSRSFGSVVDASGRVINSNATPGGHVPRGGHFRPAPMPYYMEFSPAVGMHGGYLPGYPASHGCVRMPRDLADKAWHGVRLNQPDWSDHSHSVAFTAEIRREKLLFHLILNAYWEPLDFELPPAANDNTNPWSRWIDTAQETPNDIVPMGGGSSFSGTYLSGRSPLSRGLLCTRKMIMTEARPPKNLH